MASPSRLSRLFGREVETHSCAGKTHVHIQGEERSHVHGSEPYRHPVLEQSQVGVMEEFGFLENWLICGMRWRLSSVPALWPISGPGC